MIIVDGASLSTDTTGSARAAIVAVETAVPSRYVEQEQVLASYAGRVRGGESHGAATFSRSNVRKRHCVWDWSELPASGYPMIGERMQAWERHVLELGRDLMSATLERVDRDHIGTLVIASSTGYTNPGPDVTLAKEFGLRNDLRRTFIGHMGCYAAFNAIKLAMDAVAVRPDQLAVVGCVELSSLHLRDEATTEQAVVHSLFGDAGAMIVISADPVAVGPAIVRTHTETHYDASAMLTLRIHDDCFRMTLSPGVPRLLLQVVRPFLERLLTPVGLTAADVRHWGIHPGGPKIVNLLGRRLNLSEEQLQPSRHVLAEFGNCASATILLILQQIMASGQARPGEYGVFMAFGPGLTVESMLVRF
ncbi:type III polyketide synthase [Kibdelosporangium philippinense]|uniref:Type III polyketide synthase n=1 Tax=Kibdelosporangium philippinense TaxID=211113 RepID=A0ABS8Z8G0_9PSEU|nr:type III polyketide synthase [Kibdelosporangium philippinense]